jgi:hypothetical protein
MAAWQESHTTEVTWMNSRLFACLLLGLTLSLPVVGQSNDAQDNGGIKQDTKDAAHSTAKATKKTGRKIKHGTKKVVHKGAHATSKGASSVEDKTKPSPSPTPR